MRILSTFAAVVLALLWLGGCEKKMPKGDPVAGRELFERGCAVCHHANATQTKVGPGLLGLYKLKALPNGEAVTDENIERWVRNGGGQMPGFKNAISPEQMRDLIAYLKTL